jgi:mono/diheme cytochrome c family protein
MRPAGRIFLPAELAGLALLALVLVFGSALAPAFAQGDPTRGEYIAKAAGCLGCHTEARTGAVAYAGGRELKSPFGSFFGPNITPHPTAGIGAWTRAQFATAMREGRRPDGAHYFPAFPYTAFTKITDGDLDDLWAYLRSLPPSDRVNRAHELDFPYNIRLGVLVWKFLNFTPGPLPAIAGASPAVARGAYLVEALGHCGECHTPRDALGGLKTASAYAGSVMGKVRIPNITPAALAKWSDGDLKEFLTSGMTPDGDFAGGEMGEVIRNSTSQLRPDDLAAMIAYLRTLPPRAAP